VGNGGPYISSRGATVGTAATFVPSNPATHGFFCSGLDGSVPFVFHAFVWHNGDVTDLGALPPAVDNCSDALAVNASGEIAGGSENGLIEPVLGLTQVRAVLWKDGHIKDLGTFGGNLSQASAINNRGQIVGFALNTIPDPFSLFYTQFGGPSIGTQTRAFLWEKGRMQDLGTLGGPDAQAVFVNERGQVAGVSYTSSTPNPATGLPTVDPFLWTKDDGLIDLGNFGGTSGGPTALNNRGQVIGISNLAGDEASDPFLWDNGKLIDLFTATIGGIPVTANAINDTGEVVGAAFFPNQQFAHAYLWKNGVATDLGTLPGDCFSQAFAINARGQVVGQSLSCDFFTSGKGSVFLWENGSMIDLNAFVPPGSGVQLAEGLAINDRGEIGGLDLPPSCTGIPVGYDAECGHAYVLIPCDGDHAGVEGCQEADTANKSVEENEAAPPVPAQTTATQPNLTPTEMRDRVRSLLFNRNRRFRTLQPK
jgi:probable HAF family extracellular repeat protein